MKQQLQSAIETAITSATGRPVAIVNQVAATGGCINAATIVTTCEGVKYLVKSNPNAPPTVFQAEKLGLQAMRNTMTIRVPELIAIGPLDSVDNQLPSNPSFLVLEYVQPGRPQADFSQRLARDLAEMHRSGRSDHFGFSHDNFIGATPQPNRQSSNWIEFWIENRIGFQLKLIREKGIADELSRLEPRFRDRLPKILDSPDEPPALIHGDLWSGNYLVSGDGSPVLIDPAVYYAQREAEFGMTTLFGGFDRRFYDAYQECWPLSEGWEERVEIYRLYHLLNHLNLFGRSYLSGCIEIMKKYI